VAGRTEEFEWSAYEGDGKTPVAFASDDLVRFKLAATDGGVPTLDLVSNAETDNGSLVTITALGVAGTAPATGLVRLAQGDTLELNDTMYFEMNLVDHSDEDRIKQFLRGRLLFLQSQGGAIGP
jgi:hypothetical protein